jgi:hypothetical protein
VLARADFVASFEREVDADDDFQAVLAYQGAIGTHLADRSTCEKAGAVCDWKRPPLRRGRAGRRRRFPRQLRRSARPANEGSLIWCSRHRSLIAKGRPFSVYVATASGACGEVSSQTPAPDYVAFDERLKELAVGPAGERAGDALLANNGNLDQLEQRAYFRAASLLAWQPKQDGEIRLSSPSGRQGAPDRGSRAPGAGRRGQAERDCGVALGMRYGPAKCAK